MFQIGNVKIKNNVVMAPMAGISNSAYRTIIKNMGCGLIVAEMVSDKAVCYKNKKTLDMLYMTDYERPISQQIFGNSKDSFVEAAKYIEGTMHPDIIDINMGCPVPKVAQKTQAGSALLKNPEKVYEIVKSVVDNVNVPVTVKIRSGWDSEHVNAVEIAKIVERAGASAITVHGRTRNQGYSGKVDLDIIKSVKENVRIPVIGNGDIKSCYDAKYMLDYTKCDAIMIGRGIIGNPWLIRDCVNYLKDSTLPYSVSLKDRIDMINYHLDLLLKTKSEKAAVLEIRMHISNYLKGASSLKDLKQKIFKTNNLDEIKHLLSSYLDNCNKNK